MRILKLTGWFFRIKELGGYRRTSAVTGNLTSCILLRNSSSTTQNRNDAMINVIWAYPSSSVKEKIIDYLSCFGIKRRWLDGAYVFPGCNGFTDTSIHWFGKCCSSFVDWYT